MIYTNIYHIKLINIYKYSSIEAAHFWLNWFSTMHKRYKFGAAQFKNFSASS